MTGATDAATLATIDQHIAALEAEATAAAQGPSPDGQPRDPQGRFASPSVDPNAEPAAEDQAAAPEEVVVPEPVVPLPDGWGEAEKAAFAALPEDVQRGVHSIVDGVKREYTVKAQEAEQTKAQYEAEIPKVVEAQKAFIERGQMALQAVDHLMMSQWAHIRTPQDAMVLSQQDPIGYSQYTAQLNLRNALMGDLQNVSRQAQETERQAMAKARAEEAGKLLDAVPELKAMDEGSRLQWQAGLKSYATRLGITEQQWAGLQSHVAYVALDKARKYDEMVQKAAKAPQTLAEKRVAPASRPTLPAGTPVPAAKPNALQEFKGIRGGINAQAEWLAKQIEGAA